MPCLLDINCLRLVVICLTKNLEANSCKLLKCYLMFGTSQPALFIGGGGFGNDLLGVDHTLDVDVCWTLFRFLFHDTFDLCF